MGVYIHTRCLIVHIGQNTIIYEGTLKYLICTEFTLGYMSVIIRQLSFPGYFSISSTGDLDEVWIRFVMITIVMDYLLLAGFS